MLVHTAKWFVMLTQRRNFEVQQLLAGFMENNVKADRNNELPVQHTC